MLFCRVGMPRRPATNQTLSFMNTSLLFRVAHLGTVHAMRKAWAASSEFLLDGTHIAATHVACLMARQAS